MKRLALIIIALLSLVVARAEEQTRVSILTCAPGSEVYQLEGHSGLRLQSPAGADVTVNWGVFDFNSPGFVPRFVKGETDYLCAAYPTALFLEEYRREGRQVTEQELSLTPEETERLLVLVADNLRPQNRIYRYNYVYDNCATRPLHLVEQALGDTLRLAAPSHPAAEGTTFREVMTRFHDGYPWYQFGIDLALGSGIDRPLARRNYAFAPELLSSMLASARRPDGTPIVKTERVLLAGQTAVEPPTPWWLTPMTVGVIVLIVSALLTLQTLRRRRFTLPFRIVASVYYAVAGLTGLVLTFLIFVSVHEATSPNWLYLWLNPLCLVAAVGVWIKSAKRLVVCYQIINFVLLILMLGLVGAGVQRINPAFLPLVGADLLLTVPWLTSLRHHSSK